MKAAVVPAVLLLVAFLVNPALVEAQPDPRAGLFAMYSDGSYTNKTIDDTFATLHDVYLVHRVPAGAISSSLMIAQDPGVGLLLVSTEIMVPLAVGDVTTGIVFAYSGCQTGDVLLARLTYFGSGSSSPCSYLRVVPNPSDGQLISVDCSSNTLVPDGGVLAVNPTSCCPLTHYVPFEYATIQQAVGAAAAQCDTIKLATGTYTGAGNRDVVFGSKDLALKSAAGPESTIVDCESAAAGFAVSDGRIEGITIQHAHSAIYSTGQFDLENCILFENYPDFGGFVAAGLTCEGPTTVRNSVFAYNTAEGPGAIWATGTVDITGCQFIGNGAGNGSGGAVVCDAGSVIRDSDFSDNTAFFSGGAISGSPDSIIACSFSGNRTTEYNSPGGGALEVYNTVVHDCLFTGNASLIGAVVRGSNTTFRRCTLYDNVGAFEISGSVIAAAGGSINLDHCVVAFSQDGMAAECLTPGSVTATCTDIYGNPDGDWVGCLAGQNGVNGNISADPLFCDAPGGDLHLRSSSPCLLAICGVMGLFGQGCWDATAVEDEGLPRMVVLYQNAPNPFNPTTRIRFALPAGAAVELTVYDAVGRRVKELLRATLPEGVHEVEWDGRDGRGREVSSGVYYYRLRTGAKDLSRAMILLK